MRRSRLSEAIVANAGQRARLVISTAQAIARKLSGVSALRADDTRGCVSGADNEPVGTISIETTIAAPVVACFDLSLSVDAHTHSMGRSGERAVAGVTSGVLTLGDSVTWQARHFGIPFRMTAAVTEYERPKRFVDEQRRGPFQRWRHEHTFTVLSRDRTLMVDRVEFRSPFGAIGRLADVSVLDRYMTRLLRRRNEWLRSALEGQGS